MGMPDIGGNTLSEEIVNDRIDLSGRQLGALIGVMLLSFAANIGLTYNISAIAMAFDVERDFASYVASAELLGIAINSLLFAQLAGRLNPHRTFWIGVLVVIAMNMAAIIASDLITLGILRFISGLALGAIVATVMATASRSRNPEMTFAWINAAVAGMGIILNFVIPRSFTLGERIPGDLISSESDGLFVVYLILAVLALLFVRATPKPKKLAAEGTDTASQVTKLAPAPLIGWISLFGLSFIFLGHGLIAIFFAEIGLGIPLDTSTIGNVGMAASAIGMFASLGAGVIGARYKAKIPIGSVLILLVVLAPMVAVPSSPLMFFLAAPLFLFLPIAIMPIFLGALVRIDPSGRQAASNPAFAILPGALAPAIGGPLSLMGGGFALNGWAAVGFILLGAALMAGAIFKSDQIRSGKATD